MSRTNHLLNALWAVARKKSELNHQEREVVRAAARILELELRQNREYREKIAQLEEQLAIMQEGNGLLQDDGEPFPPAEKKDDFWDDDWPIEP